MNDRKKDQPPRLVFRLHELDGIALGDPPRHRLYSDWVSHTLSFNHFVALSENPFAAHASPVIFTTSSCPEPIVIMESKMYVGGTNASGSGGKTVDYGFINKNTNNTALVEIKNPTVKLLAREYRGMYPPSWELAGSVIQVQNYKYEVLRNLPILKDSYGAFDAVNIPTYVITGNTTVLTSDVHKRSFELYRKTLSGTIVLAFDEVFERLRLLLNN